MREELYLDNSIVDHQSGHVRRRTCDENFTTFEFEPSNRRGVVVGSSVAVRLIDDHLARSDSNDDQRQPSDSTVQRLIENESSEFVCYSIIDTNRLA